MRRAATADICIAANYGLSPAAAALPELVPRRPATKVDPVAGWPTHIDPGHLHHRRRHRRRRCCSNAMQSRQRAPVQTPSQSWSRCVCTGQRRRRRPAANGGRSRERRPTHRLLGGHQMGGPTPDGDTLSHRSQTGSPTHRVTPCHTMGITETQSHTKPHRITDTEPLGSPSTKLHSRDRRH